MIPSFFPFSEFVIRQNGKSYVVPPEICHPAFSVTKHYIYTNEDILHFLGKLNGGKPVGELGKRLLSFKDKLEQKYIIITFGTARIKSGAYRDAVWDEVHSLSQHNEWFLLNAQTGWTGQVRYSQALESLLYECLNPPSDILVLVLAYLEPVINERQCLFFEVIDYRIGDYTYDSELSLYNPNLILRTAVIQLLNSVLAIQSVDKKTGDLDFDQVVAIDWGRHIAFCLCQICHSDRELVHIKWESCIIGQIKTGKRFSVPRKDLMKSELWVSADYERSIKWKKSDLLDDIIAGYAHLCSDGYVRFAKIAE
jgi:hypothetical protein